MGEPAPRFGDIIENGWASERNPTRVGFFVREGRRTGRMNPGRYFEVTDGAGKFWELPVTSDHKITVRPALLQCRIGSRGRQMKPSNPPTEGCRHETLTFSGGGFFVVCRSCRVSWVAVLSTMPDVVLDEGRAAVDLGEMDRREDPRKSAATQ